MDGKWKLPFVLLLWLVTWPYLGCVWLWRKVATWRPTPVVREPFPNLGEDQDDISLLEGQILDLMQGIGASEDHEDVQKALRSLGLTETACNQIRERLCNQKAGTAAIVRDLRDTLERASNGLKWYRDSFPEADSGADDEIEGAIHNALEDAAIYLGEPRE